MGRRALPITADFILGETDVNPLESLKSVSYTHLMKKELLNEALEVLSIIHCLFFVLGIKYNGDTILKEICI